MSPDAPDRIPPSPAADAAASPPPPPADAADIPLVEAALELARRCRYEREHTHQVTRLALALFDELRDLHGLGPRERVWLHLAALLHDIGWIEGQKGHHKTALRIIREDPALPLDARERNVVGSIARYHRKALPDEKHGHWNELSEADRPKVARLAAILRVADGLDRTHRSVVRGVTCRVEDARVTIRCTVAADAGPELAMADEKGDLLRNAFGRKLRLETEGPVGG